MLKGRYCWYFSLFWIERDEFRERGAKEAAGDSQLLSVTNSDKSLDAVYCRLHVAGATLYRPASPRVSMETLYL
jgi:hypothetical protein